MYKKYPISPIVTNGNKNYDMSFSPTRRINIKQFYDAFGDNIGTFLHFSWEYK